ncbi:hypothetical protein NM208_g3926 [Fusarium decemcellulare]|uniref:Uncharacterized protein n=1 Tax=Fusarium decemcellulare TaxID=57161 RepID=A0ACC1SMR7_9HYPO|nr:hypothetical protein NM208_g3926 [Fusarium decemcellulare]
MASTDDAAIADTIVDAYNMAVAGIGQPLPTCSIVKPTVNGGVLTMLVPFERLLKEQIESLEELLNAQRVEHPGSAESRIMSVDQAWREVTRSQGVESLFDSIRRLVQLSFESGAKVAFMTLSMLKEKHQQIRSVIDHLAEHVDSESTDGTPESDVRIIKREVSDEVDLGAAEDAADQMEGDDEDEDEDEDEE